MRSVTPHHVMCAEQRRFHQYDRIYLSPHMDDVAYSCSGRILHEREEGLRVLVITVFGNGKSLRESVSGSRFGDYAERLQEERAAMDALDADFLWLNEPELLFRRKAFSSLVRYFTPFLPAPEPAVQGRLIAIISALCQSMLAPDGEVLCPLGVGFHPDHRLIFEVGRALHSALHYRVRFYEDLPYGLGDELTHLRHRFLGDDEAQVNPYRAAQTAERLVQSLGLRRWPVTLLIFCYLAVLVALQRVTGWYDRFKGQPLPESEERPIEDVVHAKADVMRLYASQTRQFFPDNEGLVERLRRKSGFVERTYTFPREKDDTARREIRALLSVRRESR